MIVDMLDTVSRLTTGYKIISITYLLVIFIAAIALYRIKKLNNISKNILILIMICSVIRLLVFNNPLSFKMLSRELNLRDMGWRQRDAMKHDWDGFFKWGPYEYLVIGSSQVAAIFNGYARNHKNVKVFSIAGMGPQDFVLYQPYIKNYNVENIILYLSDLDLCRPPSLLGAKLAPMQPVEKMAQLLKIFHRQKIPGNYLEFVLANYFPEYRYQYLMKAFLHKRLGKRSAFPHEDGIRKSQEEVFKHAIESLQKRTDEWIDYNSELLSHFLQWCNEINVRVIIVDGHYHPQALKNSRGLYLDVKKKIKALSQSYGSIYVDRENLHQFTDNDYRDVTHVHRQSGYVFSEKMFHFLEKKYEGKRGYASQ
jgi:hypothetical protein